MPSRSRERTPLSAARAYAERGWPVFPLLPRDKRPFPKTRGFEDATTNRDQVQEWWAVFPDANIGLATGVVFSVLDIDGTDGVLPLQRILGTDYRHGGPVVGTGKGKHLYFQPVLGDRNRAGLFGGKVDYRGRGGYVVAPPSVHPSGRVYTWADGRDERRDLPPIPDALAEVILKTEARPAQIGGVINGGLRYGDRSVTSTSKGGIILERPDILDVCAERGLVVVSHGALFAVPCIFHPDRSPSLILYPDNTFHCYGCEAHGDSIDLQQGVDMTGRKAI
jgi:hypothetical protein